MMTVGLGVVGSTYSFASQYQLQDATPLAQLMSEPEGILVPGDSPYETLDDLVQAWKDDPGELAVGGGSSPGGPDHLFPMQLADEIGIDPNDVNYVTYDGGGPLTSALLGEKIDVGFSGLAEFEGQVESGELRVLAVSGEERYPDGPFADVPTLTESDVDLVFLNWRGVLAPPDISDERTEELIGYLEEMHDSQGWQEVLAENGWTDDFKTGDDFADLHRRAGRTGVRRPSRSWGCYEQTTADAGPAGQHRRPRRSSASPPPSRWSASTRSSTRAGSTSGSATRSARGSSPTSSAPG